MKYEHSIEIPVKPEVVFATYKNVSKWPEWDLEVEEASLDGEFVVSTFGKIKPKGAPESKMQLVEVTQDQSFTIECKLPLCKMHFVHLLSTTESGTNVVNQVIFSGLLSPLFGKLIGKGINKGMPDSLEGLKRQIVNVEQGSSSNG